MARRSFDVFDLIELFTHWHAGRSQRQLAESLGIDRKTIAKYLAPAIAELLIPGAEPVTEAGGRRTSPAGFLRSLILVCGPRPGRASKCTVTGSGAGCVLR
jgi:hypothetical protein